jgi:hypothetical protein
MHKPYFLTIFVGVFSFSGLLQAQDSLPPRQYVYQTFKDTRVINIQSVEVLQKNTMDFRIMHRFGDLFGAGGGWQTFYGLENVADVSIGLEYGATHQLTLGVSRTKGAGELTRLLNGQAKYRLMHQTTDNAIPLSMTVVGTASFSSMPRGPRSPISPSVSDFPKFAHRWAYAVEWHVAKKFSHRFSLQLSPTLVWRNYVPNGDHNLLLGMNLASRLQLTKVFGILVDANLPVSSLRWGRNSGYYFPLGIGLEVETGGHVFQLNFTNSKGVMPTDYLPYTRSNWLDGAFRLGFTISRVFRV